MGTQQWHHVHSPKVGRHPPLPPAAMAPSNVGRLPRPQPQHTTMAAMAPLPQTWPSLPFPAAWHTTMAPCNGTQQWHYIHSPKVGRNPPPPNNAHYNGTLQWHAMAPRPLPQSWSSPSPPPTIAHYNGNQQWHSPKVGRHPPPQP